MLRNIPSAAGMSGLPSDVATGPVPKKLEAFNVLATSVASALGDLDSRTGSVEGGCPCPKKVPRTTIKTRMVRIAVLLRLLSESGDFVQA